LISSQYIKEVSDRKIIHSKIIEKKSANNMVAKNTNNNNAAADLSSADDAAAAAFDSSFFEEESRFEFMEREAIAAGAVPVEIEIDQKMELYHPFNSYSVARPQKVNPPGNGSTPSQMFTRLQKNKRFCLVNSEDNYDKRNPLEMEFYHQHLDAIMKKRRLTVYILEPRDKKIQPTAAKRPKYESDYNKYDTPGYYPFKFCK
jgi:hypothetical protein